MYFFSNITRKLFYVIDKKSYGIIYFNFTYHLGNYLPCICQTSTYDIICVHTIFLHHQKSPFHNNEVGAVDYSEDAIKKISFLAMLNLINRTSFLFNSEKDNIQGFFG